MTGMHLAELNIARLKHPLDDPRVAGFTGNLDRVNAVAERSPGFVWRLTGEGDDATDLSWDGDPKVIVNLSVWESAETLEAFVFRTVHARIYQNRAKWFDALESHHFVMWWVQPGHRPTLAEARERLERLDRDGPTTDAFGWESLPQLQDWRALRCA